MEKKQESAISESDFFKNYSFHAKKSAVYSAAPITVEESSEFWALNIFPGRI